MECCLAKFIIMIFTALSSENKSGSVCGTPNYIAPEVLHKQGHSTASEVNIFTDQLREPFKYYFADFVRKG